MRRRIALIAGDGLAHDQIDQCRAAEILVPIDTFRAEHDCIVAMSACPQDLVPVNGHGCTPKAVGYAILD